ncbi:hypothetical protein RSAG8_01033, partial [Rhizoctonia solani AG-8 WAC10335]
MVTIFLHYIQVIGCKVEEICLGGCLQRQDGCDAPPCESIRNYKIIALVKSIICERIRFKHSQMWKSSKQQLPVCFRNGVRNRIIRRGVKTFK